ncbi:hypothetical protein IWX90DRAFT_130600 [Phyllosticta citrichinensis]|uniref:Heterokaryon incompatibility domain-containing protein n=1 Tax=Phyllosticta citrichinensis TaxID=1130410 RepID=A0ABR1Y5F3_9PEZI
MLNWTNVRSWLDHAPAIPPLRQLPPGFRLVDVVDKKVVSAPSQPFDYVCLSYVWGERGEDLLASSSNINELQQDKSLAESRVPATIQDAMTACQHLGQRYLWVVRLCILQDDDSGSPQRGKQAQIEKMGEIYPPRRCYPGSSRGDQCGTWSSRRVQSSPTETGGGRDDGVLFEGFEMGQARLDVPRSDTFPSTDFIHCTRRPR